MKRIILLISVIVCLYSIQAKAQMVINIFDNESSKTEPIDDIQFVAQYQMNFINDTLNPDKVTKETMMLKAGSKSSLFYSYTRFITDSIMLDQVQKSGSSNFDSKNQNPGLISYRIYKNYPTGKVTTLDQIATTRLRCEEENEQPVWELLPDTMTILSYPCLKAVCHFKGRDYEAWFTPEIPRSEGPWKLYGLPGLILKAEDSRKHFSFECTGIVQGKPEETILFGADGYESVSRKNLDKIYERYAKDPLGYIASTAPNVKIVVKNESGESIRPKDTPYNPIEIKK